MCAMMGAVQDANNTTRSDTIMAKSTSKKTMRKRRRIRNKRLRHLKPTRKGWRI